MAMCPKLLIISLLFLPVMVLGQSYEWSDQTGQAPTTTSWQVEASGIRYLLGRL